MPPSLPAADRRRIVLMALGGASPTEIARRTGTSRQNVYKLVDEEKREAAEELAYWTRVAELLKKRDAS